jgi:hypothetical protein
MRDREEFPVGIQGSNHAASLPPVQFESRFVRQHNLVFVVRAIGVYRAYAIQEIQEGIIWGSADAASA